MNDQAENTRLRDKAQKALDILDEPLQARSLESQVARAKNVLRSVLSGRPGGPLDVRGFEKGGLVPGKGYVWVPPDGQEPR